MSYCYMGKILWVNLTEETFKEENLANEIYREYIGGYGLAASLIYKNLTPKINALDPNAILGFFPGLLTGTVAPLTGRFMVAGKSPLTGTWGDSNCGGYFGPEIKRCGYDAILIRGAAKSPKSILICDDKKQIIDATDIWGLDVVNAENRLVEKYGKVQVASIGKSGENLSLISGIVNDRARIAARSGFGAVMGSKKLKAIVLKGHNRIELADKDTFLKLTKKYNESVNITKVGAIEAWRSLGTSSGNVVIAKIGDTPIKNWSGSVKEDFSDEKLAKISGVEIAKFKQKPYGCFSCPVRCGAIMKVPELGIEETHRPEYETCASFGPLLLNNDLMSLFLINDLCNRAGLDTISTGTVVAFAIECYENGILSKNDTDGQKLTWGNSSAIIELVKKIINREGIGDLLADGTKSAAEKIGKGSEKYAIHSLGQELGMHSPKYFKSLGITYAFDPTPGRHTAASLDMLAGGPMIKPDGLFEGFELPKRFKRSGEDRNEALKLITAIYQTTCCIGLCEFAYFFQRYPLLELLKAATGWDLTIDELVKTGIRIQTLRQAFTLREGINIINNTLPERVGGADSLAEYKGYCEKIGWNPQNGFPLKETLMNLNLDFVIKDLY